MNEQIKKLGSKAMSEVMNGSDPYGDADRMYIPAEFMEKFAELIVREGVSIISKRKNHAIDNDWNLDEAMSMAEMDLEEHFGVES